MKFDELLRQNGHAVAPQSHHHARHGWVQFDCPFCSPRSGKFRMGYSINRGSINCWVCGKHRLWETLRALPIRGDYKQISRALRGRRVVLPDHTGYYQPPTGLTGLCPAHVACLQRRFGQHWDPAYLTETWGLQATTHHARIPWRIWAPIHDAYGRPVSWTARSIKDDHKQRWLSASEDEEAIPAGELVYGIHLVQYTAVIHEGPTDVWATGPGAVGMLGVATTAAQIAQVAKVPRRFVCYDTSNEAQKRARALCEQLALFPGETTNIVLDAEDAGSATKKELEKLRKFCGI